MGIITKLKIGVKRHYIYIFVYRISRFRFWNGLGICDCKFYASGIGFTNVDTTWKPPNLRQLPKEVKIFCVIFLYVKLIICYTIRDRMNSDITNIVLYWSNFSRQETLKDTIAKVWFAPTNAIARRKIGNQIGK